MPHVEMPSLLCFVVVFLHVTDLITVIYLNSKQLFGSGLTCKNKKKLLHISSFSHMRVILANDFSLLGVYRLADTSGIFA